MKANPNHVTATYNKRDYDLKDGKMVEVIKPMSVRVLAISDSYAMVKRNDLPGYFPLVARIKDLVFTNDPR